MDAHFGILPPVSEERDLNHLTVDEQRLTEDIARTLGLAEFLPPPSVVTDPIATTDFLTANDVGNYAPLGWPGIAGGFQGENMGLGFPSVAVQNSSLPPTTLPALSPSSSIDSPSPLTPPEAFGGLAAYRNPVQVALSDIPLNYTPAPGADANLEPSLLTTAKFGTGIGHPATHIQSLPLSSTAGGDTFPYRFGEEATVRREFGFRYQIPRDHPNYHRPSHPRPSGGFHFFRGPAAQQYTPRTQEFVRGSTSSAVNPSDWLPVSSAPQLAAMPLHLLAPHAVAPYLPPNYALYPPSAFADHRHLSTFDALGALPTPPGHSTLQVDAVAGPSAPTSTLGKRRAEPLSKPGPSKARKTKTSAHSRRSQQAPPEPGKENAPAAPDLDSDFEPECKHTNKIDWTNPPKWGKDAIPSDKAPKEIFPYLSKKYGNEWKASSFRCRYDECTRVCGSLSSLRSHVAGKAHMDLRSECLRCGWDVRTDNFSSRHMKEQCDKKYEKKMNAGKRQRKQ